MLINSVESKLSKDANLYLIFIVTLFAVMGVASIAPAFPQMIRFFSITEREAGWLIASFTLPGVILAPFTGMMADRLGRKNILIPSLMLFGLAGFACFFSKTFIVLIVFRFFQGAGAAALGSLNVTLIGDLYEGKKRNAAMGYNASVLSIGTALYPLIGGSLAILGWQFPFLLPLLAIPLGLLIAAKLKNPEPVHEVSVREYLSKSLKNFGSTQVLALFGINVLVFFLLYGASLTYFPLLLEERLNANSLHIGLTISLMSVATAITSSQITRINDLIGSSKILPLAVIMYGLSMLLVANAHSWPIIIVAILIFGFGHGLFIPTIQTRLVSLAPMNERAGFMSINLMILRLGQTLGPVVMGLSFAIGGLKTVFYSGSVIAVLMLAIILIFLKGRKNS